MSIKKIFLAVSAALTVMASVSLTASADTVKTDSISATALAPASGGEVAPYRPQDRISSYVKSHSFSEDNRVTYARYPDLTPPFTDPGELTVAPLENGLNALNTVRYIAGLSEVTLNNSYNDICQYGAYISMLNGSIAHFPARPDGVTDDIFNKGYDVCSKSNLAAGFKNLAASIFAYMDDSDSDNIAVLGHRRWCLNPVMEQTGFGFAENSAKPFTYFSSMYAFDNTRADTDIKGVCWPARNMPVSYFASYQAWSYSFGTKIADPSKISVSLTRKSDGKTWRFSDGSSDGDFYVDNTAYGQPGCVIFRPANVGSYKAGDEFAVHISGSGTSVDYTVNFFSLNDPLMPVTGLTAQPSVNSVKLSWTKSAKADSYQVDICKNGEWTYLVKTPGTSFTVNGLSSNTDYQFRVYAYSGSAYSSSVNVSARTNQAPYDKPSTVTGFSASPSTNSITLSWNKAINVDKYQIDVYKNGKWTYLTKTADTSYTVTGLSEGTTYQYRIFAFNGNSYSSSAKVAATTRSASGSSGTSSGSSTGRPAAVTKFSAASTENSVTLSWNKASGADSYQIDVFKNGKWTYVTKTTDTSYTVKGLAANTGYQYRIFSFKGSSYSSSAKLTVFTKSASSSASSAAKPAAVTNFTAVPDTASSVKLAWSRSANADSYQIDVYKNGKWTYLTKTSELSYTATGLSSDTSYLFRIFAFNGSAHSSSTRVETSLKPAAVTGLYAAPSYMSVRLSWKASAGADSYQIDRYENGRWVYAAKTTDTSYTISGLDSGYIYNFRVYAYKGNAYSEPAYISSFSL